MRLLADENIEREFVEALRELGHDAAWGQDAHRQWPDTEVLQLAVTEHRVLLTADKDFGELVYARGLAPIGIILLRLSSDDMTANLPILRRAMPELARLGESHFAVVTDTRIRVRPLRVSPRSHGAGA